MSTKNLIILLTAVTAIIHLVLGLVSDPVNVLFILNGIGYGVLLWALLWTPGFLSGYKSFIQYAFIGFTLLTVVLYFVFQGRERVCQPNRSRNKIGRNRPHLHAISKPGWVIAWAQPLSVNQISPCDFKNRL